MGKPKLLETRCSPCYIADLFKELETNQDQAKLDEIEEIGFGFLKLVPKWQVRQGIMVMLAKAYDTETSTLKLENGNIRILPELFQRLFGIPPGVDDFPPFDSSNAAHAIKKYQHKNNKSCEGCMLGLLVLYFQKLKHGELEGCQEPEPWLSAWTAKELSAMAETIQPEDCGEPGRNEDDGKEDAALEETSDPSPEQVDVDHRKESSHLDGVREVSKDPDTHAVASDGDDDDDEPIAKRLRRRSVSRMTPQSSMQFGTSAMVKVIVKLGSTMKGGFSRASLRTTHQTGISEDDDDDDQPIGIRIRIKTLQRKTPQRGMVEGKIITSMQSHSSNQPTETVAPEPKTPSTELVEFPGANIEKGVYPSRPISIDPIQAIIPRGSSYRTPSPQRPSFSLGLTQLFKSPSPSPPRPIHPLLRGRKITEREEQRIRGWAVNTSLDSHETLASYEGRPNLVLSRKDVCTLRPRAWLNNKVVHWMCCAFNDSGLKRFTRDFYCVCPGILEMVLVPKNLENYHDGPNPTYVGLGQNFGADTSYFDKEIASNRNWWFFPVCITRHWWVYAFNVSGKRLFVLDSIYSKPDTARSRLDSYAARIIEDIAQVAIPTYRPTQKGLPCTYASVPIQPNGFDCGVYTIKYMEYWTEDKKLNDWEYDVVKLYRLEIILDIILCHKNISIGAALNALDSRALPPVRRNQPRNKRMEVRTPFTAPNTKSILRRVGGKPKKKSTKRI
ncbi:uncharacterized protein DS421_17g574320 [Arachis hypogaea]|nr:uncharacterized protein DS421_17g574320 [Arachis hypogaea]